MSQQLLNSAWDKGLEAPMTAQEAAYVWRQANDMAQAFPEGSRILWLNDRLAAECSNGKRCGVCGQYENEDCAVDC